MDTPEIKVTEEEIDAQIAALEGDFCTDDHCRTVVDENSKFDTMVVVAALRKLRRQTRVLNDMQSTLDLDTEGYKLPFCTDSQFGVSDGEGKPVSDHAIVEGLNLLHVKAGECKVVKDEIAKLRSEIAALGDWAEEKLRDYGADNALHNELCDRIKQMRKL